MGVMIYSFNLNILPKTSYGVLECDNVVTELHAYDFVIRKRRYLRQTLYICSVFIRYLLHLFTYMYHLPLYSLKNCSLRWD